MASAGNTVSSFASKTKTKKKHFVAQKVKLFRASDPLLSVLMWGINHSVSQTCSLFLCLCPLLINELELTLTTKEKFSMSRNQQLAPSVGSMHFRIFRGLL